MKPFPIRVLNIATNLHKSAFGVFKKGD